MPYCQKCYDRGYYDARKGDWVPPKESDHFESYQEGWDDAGGGAKVTSSGDWCEECYERGKNDGRRHKWVPPDVGGKHYSSYKEGYEKTS